MMDNPPVTSKAMRTHGMPRHPTAVGHAGGTTEPGMAHERHAPSKAHHAEHGTVHTYSPDHPAMAGMHHGAKAKHPMHNSEQDTYEGHGYGGKRG
jgi:hypothetical protein